jgi:uncharacterized protein YaiL (DUF2058 family)
LSIQNGHPFPDFPPGRPGAGVAKGIEVEMREVHMSESLRDQLLKAGFKPSPSAKPGKPARPPPQPRRSRESVEPDLAKAFALRAQVERAEREAAEREARAKAAARKERKRKLQALLDDKSLNKPDADRPRHFEFAGKIRRVYVTPGQLQQVNAGELGVVMHGGRALVVARDTALAVQAIAPEVVALLVDPSAPAPDDGVPDDLIW